MIYEKELQAAIQAVRDAGNLCRMIRRDFHPDNAADKEDKSPVTVADYCAQAVISAELFRRFPEDMIVGEESIEDLTDNANLLPQIVNYLKSSDGGFTEKQFIDSIARCGHTGGGGRFWTVDPIDGTKGFLRNDQYAVALA
ncbi:MAG: 3'(2'),5'-bisphosphate nucleotidase, partial [FCB group bacterium]|nr:3'(2'),5'-bisphosphate nucleotidase [FCB group bacterium]